VESERRAILGIRRAPAQNATSNSLQNVLLLAGHARCSALQATVAAKFRHESFLPSRPTQHGASPLARTGLTTHARSSAPNHSRANILHPSPHISHHAIHIPETLAPWSPPINRDGRGRQLQLRPFPCLESVWRLPISRCLNTGRPRKATNPSCGGWRCAMLGPVRTARRGSDLPREGSLQSPSSGLPKSARQESRAAVRLEAKHSAAQTNPCPRPIGLCAGKLAFLRLARPLSTGWPLPPKEPDPPRCERDRTRLKGHGDICQSPIPSHGDRQDPRPPDPLSHLLHVRGYMRRACASRRKAARDKHSKTALCWPRFADLCNVEENRESILGRPSLNETNRSDDRHQTRQPMLTRYVRATAPE
jgi:hypothetical protein